MLHAARRQIDRRELLEFPKPCLHLHQFRLGRADRDDAIAQPRLGKFLNLLHGDATNLLIELIVIGIAKAIELIQRGQCRLRGGRFIFHGIGDRDQFFGSIEPAWHDVGRRTLHASRVDEDLIHDVIHIFRLAARENEERPRHGLALSRENFGFRYIYEAQAAESFEDVAGWIGVTASDGF